MSYSLTFNGVTAGRTAPIVLKSISGLGHSARTARVARATGGQAATGGDVSDSRDLVAEIDITDSDPAVVEGLADQIAAAWAPIDTIGELALTSAVSTRVRRGRPTAFDLDLSLLYAGLASVRCVFESLDPLSYSAQTNVDQVSLTATTGGFGEPFGEPFGEGATSTADSAVLNAGNAPAPWTMILQAITATVNPTVIVAGRSIQLTATLAPGDQVTLDSSTERVFYNGSPRNWATFDSVWVSLPPGSSGFSVRADSGSYSATISWRDTYR